MQSAHRHLVHWALAQGFAVSVHDGEDWAVGSSTDAAEIIEAIESVEEAQIRLRRKDNNPQARIAGWALIIPHGVSPEETVADMSAYGAMTDWFNEYDRATNYQTH